MLGSEQDETVQQQAAEALWRIAHIDNALKDQVASTAGVLPALVALLGGSSLTAVKEQAAAALSVATGGGQS